MQKNSTICTYWCTEHVQKCTKCTGTFKRNCSSLTCKQTVPEIAFSWATWVSEGCRLRDSADISLGEQQGGVWCFSNCVVPPDVQMGQLEMPRFGHFTGDHLHLGFGNTLLIEWRVASTVLHSQNEIILLVQNQNSFIRQPSAVVCIYHSSIPYVKVCWFTFVVCLN